MASKAEYVRRQARQRSHACQWPGCDAKVPAAMWGCKKHWFMLPKVLRDRIWATYRPGQEKDLKPSRAYIETAREVQKWIRDHLRRSAESADDSTKGH